MYYIEFMTTYYPYRVKLSKGQLERRSRACKNNSAITITLNKHELTLTKRQINKL